LSVRRCDCSLAFGLRWADTRTTAFLPHSQYMTCERFVDVLITLPAQAALVNLCSMPPREHGTTALAT
jgi:hypothetical protein